MGQHEAGKHSKAGKAKATAQPRVPKGKPKKAASGVYHSQNAQGGGFLAKLFKRKK